MPAPGLRCAVFLGLLSVVGCAACAGRTVAPQLAAPPPTATERAVVLREAWQTVLRERAAREARITTVQDEEAAQDILARMPRVSLASGGTATLAEAMHLLLWDHGDVSLDGTYLWVYWHRVRCCVPGGGLPAREGP